MSSLLACATEITPTIRPATATPEITQPRFARRAGSAASVWRRPRTTPSTAMNGSSTPSVSRPKSTTL